MRMGRAMFIAVDANPLIVLLDQNRHGLHR